MTAVLEPRYDVIVCGAGSSGSVIAGRLAENPDLSVLLLEAGGSDEVPSVTEASQWPANLGSERDWGFVSEADPRLHGRSIGFSMGKVLGGGSSINVMIWARGHRSDWDLFAAESGQPAWGYEPVWTCTGRSRTGTAWASRIIGAGEGRCSCSRRPTSIHSPRRPWMRPGHWEFRPTRVPTVG